MENPDWKKKGLEFTPKTTSADQLPSGIRREIDDSRDNAALDADKAKEDVLKKCWRNIRTMTARDGRSKKNSRRITVFSLPKGPRRTAVI